MVKKGNDTLGFSLQYIRFGLLWPWIHVSELWIGIRIGYSIYLLEATLLCLWNGRCRAMSDTMDRVPTLCKCAYDSVVRC